MSESFLFFVFILHTAEYEKLERIELWAGRRIREKDILFFTSIQKFEQSILIK